MLRERIANIDDNTDEKFNLKLFIDILENDEKVRLLYADIPQLFDDFVSLYNQFHTSKNKYDFIGYFESLQQQVSKYKRKIEQKAKIKPNAFKDKLNELDFLQSKIGNEIFGIEKLENEFIHHNKYINLSVILKETNECIVYLDKFRHLNYIKQLQNEYKNHLAYKINLAKQSIEKDIVYKMKVFLNKAKEKMQTVANDMFKKQGKLQDDIDEKEKQKNKLKNLLRLHLAFNALKVTSKALSTFSPIVITM